MNNAAFTVGCGEMGAFYHADEKNPMERKNFMREKKRLVTVAVKSLRKQEKVGFG